MSALTAEREHLSNLLKAVLRSRWIGSTSWLKRLHLKQNTQLMSECQPGPSAARLATG